MRAAEWVQKRQRVCHITLRDIDIPGFDVARLMSDLQSLHISVATLFAGGYVATYPSRLDWQRQCPGLNGRDLFGELLAAGKECGVRIVPCIDIGEIPIDLARRQPELAALDAGGRIMEKSAVTAKSCALGPYIREYSRQLVGELTARYDIDAVKWAGASYGGTPPGCRCEHCKARYARDFGEALPEDVSDPRYVAWLERIHEETVAYLKQLAQDAGLVVIGNSVWHLGRGPRDLCSTAAREDVTQVEIQTRTHYTGPDSAPCWERFTNPVETTRYVSAVSKHPPWVVASYFLAWPWRWSAVPAAEQLLYLAQVAANGGSPMINFTTGAPHQHPDQRGMEALRHLFGLMADHETVFESDRSAAEVAVVYDHPSSLCAQRRQRAFEDYLDELYGVEDMLDRHHIPYDLISSEHLSLIDPARHRVCIVPGAMALSAGRAETLLALQKSGSGLIFTGAPGTRDPDDAPAGPQLWWQALGISRFAEPELFLKLDEACPPQAYAQKAAESHPLFDGIDAPYLAMSGCYVPCTTEPSAGVPLRRLTAFRLFPEGCSYPDDTALKEPLAVVTDGAVTFPFMPGRAYRRVNHPDHARLLINAVALMSGGSVRPMIAGRPDLRISRRRLADGRLAVHVINACGRDRFLTEFTPVCDVQMEVPPGTRQVWRVNDGKRFAVQENKERSLTVIDRIERYEIFVMEGG